MPERESCLLVLNSVTCTPQWIRQPEPRDICVTDREFCLLHHQRDHESSDSTTGRPGSAISREASATFAPCFLFMHSMRHCLQVHSLSLLLPQPLTNKPGCVLRSLLVLPRSHLTLILIALPRPRQLSCDAQACSICGEPIEAAKAKQELAHVSSPAERGRTRDPRIGANFTCQHCKSDFTCVPHDNT